MAPRKPARAGEPKLPPLWDRLQSQIYWYDRKAKSNQTAYKISKISIVALAISCRSSPNTGISPASRRRRPSWSAQPPAPSCCSKASGC